MASPWCVRLVWPLCFRSHGCVIKRGRLPATLPNSSVMATWAVTSAIPAEGVLKDPFRIMWSRTPTHALSSNGIIYISECSQNKKKLYRSWFHPNCRHSRRHHRKTNRARYICGPCGNEPNHLDRRIYRIRIHLRRDRSLDFHRKPITRFNYR